VRWENRPSNLDYLTGVLFHLNSNNCQPGSEKGFYLRDGYVEMGNAETCGSLSGNVEIGTVEGIDPMAEPQAMFEAVQIRCEANAPVRFAARGSSAVSEALCTTRLVTPTAYSVTAAPALRVP